MQMYNEQEIQAISVNRAKHIVPSSIKRYQGNKAKAEIEQARMHALFTPEVRELLIQIEDKQTMDELNGFIKVYLAQKLAVWFYKSKQNHAAKVIFGKWNERGFVYLFIYTAKLAKIIWLSIESLS